MDNLLEWLQRVYKEDFCNGSWEHTHGVTIDTLDPGWDFTFDLRETDLEGIDFKEILMNENEENWYQCWKEDGIFHGWGGPMNLLNILEVFHNWFIETTTFLEEGNKRQI